MEQDQGRIADIGARIKLIEAGNRTNELEHTLKTLEPQLVASVRDTVRSFSEAEGLFEVLFWQLKKHGAGIRSATAWRGGHSSRAIDCEAMVFLDRPIPGTEKVRVYRQPGCQRACLIHEGDDDASYTRAYADTRRWIASNGYLVSGAKREVYLQDGDESKGLTGISEIQYPVEIAKD